MHVVALALLSLAFQPPTEPSPPQTPQDCIKVAREFSSRRFKELGPPTSDTARQVADERLAMVRDCAARFDVDRTPVEALAPLVELLVEAQQPEAAQKAVARALAAPGSSPAQKGTFLALAVRMLLRQPKSAERNLAAEKYVDQIDALGNDTLESAIGAHSQMNGYYRADDIDSGIIKHSNWLIETGRRLSPDLRKKYGYQILSAYDNLAEAVAGQGENDRAISILKSAKTEWPEMANRVNSTLDRYLTVGSEAPPIVADTWLNHDADSLPLKGKVTLLQFTAHWCGPCQESYPGMKRLAERFAKGPFQVVFYTQLYGYFGSERPLTPAQEIERDREYYAGHGFKIPIAIGKRGIEEAYKVGGIPQIVAIDKAGRIRLIMVGYDDANEETLAAFIKSLLDEKQTNTDDALDKEFDAHRALYARHRGKDEAAFRAAAEWLVQTSARLPPQLRQKHGAAVIRAYSSVAEAEAAEGRYPHAIELLKTAQAAWPDLAQRLDPLLTRYSMIDTDAPPITATAWVSQKGTSPLPFKGKVTMVQFTAHWCGPCKFSYPAMRRLSQRFAKDGLQTAFFTQLYGYFGVLRHVAPKEEFEHSRKYYRDLGITFPIAIGTADVESAYKVEGLPQINLIDRHGKIRGVFVGYEPEMEKRLAAQIQGLLAEK